jgi:hypothetical protein
MPIEKCTAGLAICQCSLKMEYKHLSHELGHTNKTPDTIAMWTHGRKHEWLARPFTLPYHICKVPVNQSGDSNPLSWVGSRRFCWVNWQAWQGAHLTESARPVTTHLVEWWRNLALLQNRLQVPIQPPNLVFTQREVRQAYQNLAGYQGDS